MNSEPERSEITCEPVKEEISAGDGTSAYPDIYSFALIKTKDALFGFSGDTLSTFFPLKWRGCNNIGPFPSNQEGVTRHFRLKRILGA